MKALSLPPLFTSETSGDPFADACGRANAGCDAGLVLLDLAPERMRVALVLAPEVSLGRAMAMLPLCGVGFQNALGALGPPELSVQLEWSGGLRLNGGRAGALSTEASTRDADAVPDWLVMGLSARSLARAAGAGRDTRCHGAVCRGLRRCRAGSADRGMDSPHVGRAEPLGR